MKPILYDVGETAFKTDGLGTLADCTACTVTEERNGVFELQMRYPSTGAHFSDLKIGRYLKAVPAPGKPAQAFKIYSISRPIGGEVSVHAEHISYELAGNPVTGFSASGTVQSMLSELFEAGAFDNPFSIVTDFTGTSGSVSFPAPSTIRGILGGTEGSFLDKFHGEFEFDNFTVKFLSARGADNGVKIEYGKNLTDATQDESIESTYTSAVPYVRQQQNGEEAYVYLPEKYIDAPNAGYFARKKAMFVDFSSQFDLQEEVDISTLRALAQQYISENDIGVPRVSLNISFVDLADTEQYKGIAPLERVNLCDTVTVEFPQLGINTKAKVVQTTYDVLLERYNTISIGTVQTSFVREYATWQKDTNSGLNGVSQQIITQTQIIAGAKGGYVVIDFNEYGQPTQILIMDTPNKVTAQNVWRWNMGGLGFSSTGYNGPFSKIALTQDGQINADLITTGHILANIIQGGTLTDLTGKLQIDLSSGNIKINSEDNSYYMQLSPMGMRVFESESDQLRLWITPVTGYVYFDEDGNNFASLNGVGVQSDVVDARQSFGFRGRSASWTYDSGLGKYVLTGE